jgi:HlyD family secretion protein
MVTNGRAWFSRYRFGALLLAVALALAPSLLHRFRGHEVAVYPVRRTELVQTVVATGRVSALARVEIGSLVLGTVTEVRAEEGERVGRGAVLVRLRDDEARAALAQAQAALAQARAAVGQERAARAQAEARLQQVRATAQPAAAQAVLIAEAELASARRNHERVAALVGQGMLARAELDEARRQLDTAQGRHERERRLAEGSRPGGGELLAAEAGVAQAGAGIERAEAAVRQATAAIAAAEARLADTVLRAPADGTIIARSVEAGDTVQPGRTLLVLSRPGRTEIVAPVDEKNLALLAPGQQALVSADAYPGRVFRAALATVVPAVVAASGTVTAKFAVADPPPYLLPDMTVSVEVEVARKAGALAIPVEALRDPAGAPWVLAVRDGRARRVPVVLGVRGASRVEVVSGIGEGELLVPATDAKAADGEKVRVTRRLEG